jgi:hypothetical protein
MDTYEHLSINASDLVEALEGHMDEMAWLLNLESGEVVLVVNGEIVDDQDEEDLEESDHLVPIHPIASHEAFTFMEDFVEELPDGEGARALGRALGHSRPFRSFKDTLCDFPDLRERWFKYHGARMLEYAEAWLADNYPGAHLSMA